MENQLEATDGPAAVRYQEQPPEVVAAIYWERLGRFPHPDGRPWSEAHAGYAPTREELLLLARHWVGVRVGMKRGHFDSEAWGMQMDAYAATRLARIMTLLGEDAARQIVRDLAEGGELRFQLEEGRDPDEAVEKFGRAWFYS